MIPVRLLVLAKEPRPGRVKTRLCPPCTPVEAAGIARVALLDTLDAVRAAPVAGRVLAVDGTPPAALDRVIAQRGTGLAERIGHAFADTGPTLPVLQIGMDTPQVTAALLAACAERLLESTADAVLGPAEDGGWWALGLGEPRHARLLRDVPMSTDRTGRLTLDALRGAGLRTALLPVLRDVDTITDAHAVADLAPHGRFATAVRALRVGAA